MPKHFPGLAFTISAGEHSTSSTGETPCCSFIPGTLHSLFTCLLCNAVRVHSLRWKHCMLCVMMRKLMPSISK